MDKLQIDGGTHIDDDDGQDMIVDQNQDDRPDDNDDRRPQKTKTQPVLTNTGDTSEDTSEDDDMVKFQERLFVKKIETKVPGGTPASRRKPVSTRRAIRSVSLLSRWRMFNRWHDGGSKLRYTK